MFTIPDFDIHGVLPPIRPGQAGHSMDRAPYTCDMLTFCQRFGGSVERRTLLRGLLALRAEFLAIGVIHAHQWIDGSFVEDIERLQLRSPNDIDAITFAALGDTATRLVTLAKAPHLFDPPASKKRFHVDHYVLRSDRLLDEPYARLVGYWFSMWSRQRRTHQ